MKVLHILNALMPSGAERMLYSAAKEFAAHGLTCHILSKGKQVGFYACALKKVGYKIIHIPYTRTPFFLAKFFFLLRREKYDVIHIHSEAAHFQLGLLARFVSPAKIIRTVHSNARSKGWRRVARVIQRRLLAVVGIKYVAISPSVQKLESASLGNSSVLIANWYDENVFVPPTAEAVQSARLRFGLPAHELVIITLGNCSSIKNHTAVIQAVATLKAELRLIYLHVGAEEAGEPERKLGQKLGISEQILFTGPLADPREALYAADVLVMPSRDEGFGIAALEALACGLPAILFDVPGLRDFRGHFPALILVEPKVESLVSGLKSFSATQQELKTLAHREYPGIARTFYGISRGVGEYINVYKS
jgi:glycosyltransferase involved in cell wall biosynthesis